MRRTVVRGLVAGFAVVLAACGTGSSVWIDECDPKALWPSDDCLAALKADAGSDAGQGGDGGSAGGAVSEKQKCEPTGRCLDVPSGGPAGYFERVPLVVWIGPADQLDAMKCPGDEKVGTPNEQFRLYKDLDVPPATCDVCECEAAQGECAGLPEDIRIHAGPCGSMNVESTSFGGPTNWDGSCTNENAMPAGTMCGGAPCAQSVRASVLPPPTNESCKPKVARPSFTKTTTWKTGVLACSAVREENDCASTTKFCVNHVAGPDWQHCIYRGGVHSECPANFPYNAAVAYRGDVIDDRGCNECGCDAAKDGGCVATMAIYEDGACSQSPAAVNNVSSFTPVCFDLAKPGQALGSKTISQPSYLPGSCPTTGGAPVGKAVPDEKDAITFCCAPPFYQIE